LKKFAPDFPNDAEGPGAGARCAFALPEAKRGKKQRTASWAIGGAFSIAKRDARNAGG